MGLLKLRIFELAAWQMSRSDEQFDPTDLQGAVKPPNQQRKIEAEILEREQELEGAC